MIAQQQKRRCESCTLALPSTDKGDQTMSDKLHEHYLDFLKHTACEESDVPAVMFFTLWQADAQHFNSPADQLAAWVVWYQTGLRAAVDGVKPSAIAAGYRQAAAWVRLLAMEHVHALTLARLLG
jgi:hypothetical protein